MNTYIKTIIKIVKISIKIHIKTRSLHKNTILHKNNYKKIEKLRKNHHKNKYLHKNLHKNCKNLHKNRDFEQKRECLGWACEVLGSSDLRMQKIRFGVLASTCRRISQKMRRKLQKKTVRSCVFLLFLKKIVAARPILFMRSIAAQGPRSRVYVILINFN